MDTNSNAAIRETDAEKDEKVKMFCLDLALKSYKVSIGFDAVETAKEYYKWIKQG